MQTLAPVVFIEAIAHRPSRVRYRRRHHDVIFIPTGKDLNILRSPLQRASQKKLACSSSETSHRSSAMPWKKSIAFTHYIQNIYQDTCWMDKKSVSGLHAPLLSTGQTLLVLLHEISTRKDSARAWSYSSIHSTGCECFDSGLEL